MTDAAVATDRFTGRELVFHPEAAFVFIGLHPNTGFLKGQLELDRWGSMVTDVVFTTSLPAVFTAGDARAGSTKQVAAAVGEGAAALLHVRQYLHRHAHIPGCEMVA